MKRRHPLLELILWNFHEFFREPSVIFWVFIFPILLAVGLGIAFRNRPPEKITVAVVTGEGIQPVVAALKNTGGIEVQVLSTDQAASALRLGKVAVVVVPGGVYEYQYDPTRPDSLLARAVVDSALQKAAGRTDPVKTHESLASLPGSRYIDFLIPGLLGMNLMGGGMWGIGFVLAEMRMKNLLKRLIATPMSRMDLLISLVASRLVFMVTEVVLMLVVGVYVFGMIIQGSRLSILFVALLGSLCFSGLGLLCGSRARKIETISGLINLVMLPMYVLSGVFFSADRFPAAVQPFIRALPLTALNDALRAVILEGASLSQQSMRLLIVLTWGLVSFYLALRLFSWK
ncbi:MAG: ABC transporter permease [Terriglobia bacterium]